MLKKFKRAFALVALIATATSSVQSGIGSPTGNLAERPPGIGMAKPDFHRVRVLYFYGNPTMEKSISEHVPADSLVFAKLESGVEIVYAPPWFLPAHLKMDYDVLYLRALSISSDFLEVVVNEQTGRTGYVNRSDCDLRFWPEFLLSINSIEPKDRKRNLVRVKPLDHAGLVSLEYAFLKPVRVSSDWVEVVLLSDGFARLGKGWIKWREGGKLLITYSLFS